VISEQVRKRHSTETIALVSSFDVPVETTIASFSITAKGSSQIDKDTQGNGFLKILIGR